MDSKFPYADESTFVGDRQAPAPAEARVEAVDGSRHQGPFWPRPPLAINSQTFRGEIPPPYPPAAKPLGGADEGPKRAKLAKRKEYGHCERVNEMAEAARRRRRRRLSPKTDLAPGFAVAATRRPGQIGRSSPLPPNLARGLRVTESKLYQCLLVELSDGSRHQGLFWPRPLLAVNSKPALGEAPAALSARGEAAGRSSANHRRSRPGFEPEPLRLVGGTDHEPPRTARIWPGLFLPAKPTKPPRKFTVHATLGSPVSVDDGQ